MQPVVEAAWIAAGAGVLGIAGTVTVAVSGFRNTRKVTGQTIQAAAQDSIRALAAARADRLWEKQAAAYSAFITRARAYRNGLRSLEAKSESAIPISDLGELAVAADDASTLVFVVLTSSATYDGCRAVVRTINNTQKLIHDVGTRLSNNQRIKLNDDMAKCLRVFQVAVRDELGVGGIEPDVILTRHTLSK
jgi:hypothetical protein